MNLKIFSLKLLFNFLENKFTITVPKHHLNKMTARENNGKNGQVHEQDSTEVDPCLSQPSKQKSIHDKWLTGLQLKTGLTRSWVLVLGALVLFSALLFTVIVALAVAWPHLPHMLGHHLCSSPACLEAAAQVN